MSRRVNEAQAISPAVLFATIVVLLIVALGVLRLTVGPSLKAAGGKRDGPPAQTSMRLPATGLRASHG